MPADRRPGPRWPALAPGGVALLLAVLFLLAPPMGTDLSAQVARADFFAGAGFTPVDLRWYGGTVQYGYSLVAPAVMAALGARLTGAVSAVVSAVALGLLLRRTGAARPVLGGVLGALCFFGNLASGRVTYALGVALGLLGLLALTMPHPVWRRAGAAVGVLLAGVTSPVAGLFAGLAGVALFLPDGPAGRSPGWLVDRPAGRPVGRRRVDGIVVALAAGGSIAVTAGLSDTGGWMNISVEDTVRATLASLLVAVVVPRPVVRVGAVLAALGVLAAFAVHTPVGLNATRLAAMFALPVAAAYGSLPVSGDRLLSGRFAGAAGLRAARLAGAAGLVVLALVQPPVLVGDLRDAGTATAYRAYFAPLLAELRARGPVGRIEIPPTRNYWDAAHAAREVHLARGWLRQADLARNPLFYDGTLSAATYEEWLRANGVTYVALPDADLSWVGRAEGSLVRAGQPYLKQVWRGRHWTLYEVGGRPSIVDGATLVSTTARTVTVDLPAAGEVLVRVRFSRWLTAPGARLAPAGEGWTVLDAPRPGRYTLTS